MTVLVTGGAGFIGGAIIRRLLRDRASGVVNVDSLTYAANHEAIRLAAREPRYHLERVDICDSAELRRVFATHGPEAVLHLAAESHVDRSLDAPAAFIRTNVVGTFTLLEAACEYWTALSEERRRRFRFIHVSTDEVFGSLDATGSFTERSPYQPNSPYAASKAASDHFVRSWCTSYGLPCVITNCSNNYGPYQFPEKLIPLAIINALEGKAIPVYGRGTNVRDWIHVDDHADALLAVLERGAVGETYLIGSRSERRNIDVVRAICAVVDELAPNPALGTREQLIRFVNDRPAHDLRYGIDPGKIEEELGWRPARTFEDGLRDTVQWYLEHRAWWQKIRDGVYAGERVGLARASAAPTTAAVTA